MADNDNNDLLVKTGEAIAESASETATPMTVEQFAQMKAQMEADFEARLEAQRKADREEIDSLKASNKKLATARPGDRKQFAVASGKTRAEVQALLAETGIEFTVTPVAKDGTRGETVAWVAPLSAKNSADNTPAAYSKRFWVDAPTPDPLIPQVLFMGDFKATYRTK